MYIAVPMSQKNIILHSLYCSSIVQTKYMQIFTLFMAETRDT